MEIDRNSAEVWASWFRCLGDPSRVLLLNCLATASGPMTVGELVDRVDIGQSTVSHHLKVLRQAGLLASERRGSWVYYRVIPQALQRLSDVLGAQQLIGGR